MFLWVAESNYTGHDLFYFGTFFAKTEMDAYQQALEHWKSISPHPAPNFILLKGSLKLSLD